MSLFHVWGSVLAEPMEGFHADCPFFLEYKSLFHFQMQAKIPTLYHSMEAPQAMI